MWFYDYRSFNKLICALVVGIEWLLNLFHNIDEHADKQRDRHFQKISKSFSGYPKAIHKKKTKAVPGLYAYKYVKN